MSSLLFFQSLFGADASTGLPNEPWRYQSAVANALVERRNLVLTAPTGAGKTLAVLAPFLAYRKEIGARRLIYCLPMKTLAQGIHAEAVRVAALAGLPADKVTLQTGDSQGDPFFIVGDIIVCTYDQFLSGLLCGSYSLSKSQQNINAAAAAGNLVVFDEFHLMETGRAFLAAVTCLKLFRDCCRSVWMTATATAPLTQHLIEELEAVSITLGPEEMLKVERERFIQRKDVAISAAEVLAEPNSRTLAVVNTVRRSQELFEEVRALSAAHGIPSENIVLLHSRFFSRDKEAKRAQLYRLLGKGTAATSPVIVIATQVVEAGLDISAERLLTDLCPMNALVQRAGRCARFAGQSGTITVYRGPEFNALPYEETTVNRTWETLEGAQKLSHAKAAEWTDLVHQETDRATLAASTSHPGTCRKAIVDGIMKTRQGGVGDLIRAGSQTIEVFILRDPTGVRPATREAINVTRRQFYGLLSKHPGAGYNYDPEATGLWSPLVSLADAYFVAVPPAIARYTALAGLMLGQAGEEESPEAVAPPERFPFTYKREGWAAHTELVERRGAELAGSELAAEGLMGAQMAAVAKALRTACLLHDLGKLQTNWQDWALRYERSREPGYQDVEPLAHTESQNGVDRLLAREIRGKPPHSAASAAYAAQLLDNLEDNQWLAVIVSVVAHHGGWFSSLGPPVDRLEPRALAALKKLGFSRSVTKPTAAAVNEVGQEAEGLIDSLEKFWPIVSVVTRFLRLADQKATKEAGQVE